MEINNLQEDKFVDIFGDDALPAVTPGQSANFGRKEDEGLNIFDTPGSKPEEKPEEGTTPAAEATTPAEDTTPPEDKEVDIIGTGDGAGKPGRKPKYGFEDAVGYFEDRFKNGKFVQVTTTNEKGEEVNFVPKTPEEFDEVIDIQVNYRLDQEKKNLEKSWYGSKSPVWQAVARYAEMVDNPSDIIPFLQGVKTIQSVASVNEEEIDGAEKIVRTRMEQKGDSDDIIDEQIELLKTTDKLISTAKKYKPLIINEEKTYLAQMNRDAEQEELQRRTMFNTIRTKSIEAIEAPIFGKQKLKNEEKAAIFDLIGEPDEASRGYKIYTAIDDLFANGDFDTLKKIALLASNPAAFVNYLTIDAKNSTAAQLQTKLRVSTEGRQASASQEPDERERVQRNQYSKTPRFGRG